MITLQPYDAAQAGAWNEFVAASKNGWFLFDRGYMDYHSDRFADNSLMAYNGDELVAVLPANRKDDALYSHMGLTFGGFITGKRMSATAMLEIFAQLKDYCRAQGIREIYYKAIPYYYHRLPAGEDLYALFRNDAECYRRDASSLIMMDNRVTYAKGTKASLSKGRKSNLRIEASTHYATFMAIEEELLRTKYGTKPTHSLEEIELLAGRFPGNIQLWLVYKDAECLGGTITFSTGEVMHTQYIAITDTGKEVGALDTLTDYLLRECEGKKKYFSFGTSTEDGGRYLNEGLIRNKESFGARTVAFDFYKIAIHKIINS